MALFSLLCSSFDIGRFADLLSANFISFYRPSDQNDGNINACIQMIEYVVDELGLLQMMSWWSTSVVRSELIEYKVCSRILLSQSIIAVAI